MSVVLKNNSLYQPKAYISKMNKSSSMKSLPKNYYQGFIMKISTNSTTNNQSTKSSTPLSQNRRPKTRNKQLNLSCITSVKTNNSMMYSKGNCNISNTHKSNNSSYYMSMMNRSQQTNIKKYNKIYLLDMKKKNKVLKSFMEISEDYNQPRNQILKSKKKNNNNINNSVDITPLSDRINRSQLKEYSLLKNDKRVSFHNTSLIIKKNSQKKKVLNLSQEIKQSNNKNDNKGPEDIHFMLVKVLQRSKRYMVNISNGLNLYNDGIENNYLDYDYTEHFFS